MNIAFIAQARMTSSRLPGKVGMDICGESALYRMIERMRLSRHDIDIIIATTTNRQDDTVEQIASECGVKVYRGSENNVLSRYYYAAQKFNIEVIARVTCDDLLFDPRWLFDDLLDDFLEDGTYDYYTGSSFDKETNMWSEHEPACGCNTEIFTFKGIERCMHEAKDPYCIEHVTPYFYMNPDLFKCGGHGSKYSGPDILPEKFGTTLDTDNDLVFLRNIYNALYPLNHSFSTMDVIDICLRHPEWQLLISDVVRTPITYRGEGNKNTGWEWH